MNNKNTYISFSLITLLTYLCFVSSCTYDYFEDETNYVVYVPKADVNSRTDSYKINDLKIYITDYMGNGNSGASILEYRNSVSPFEENARSKYGNFHFRLNPGQFSVFCFSEVSGLKFSPAEEPLSTAKFELTKSEDGYYQEPPFLLYEEKRPTIIFPGPCVYDTAWFETNYAGRICLVFKNMREVNPLLTSDNVKRVEAIVSGIGTIQYIKNLSDSINTRSSRYTVDDKMFIKSDIYESSFEDYEFGFDNYYFPSLKAEDDNYQNDNISMRLNFYDANDNIIWQNFMVDLVDSNNNPIELHTNETLVVKVNADDITVITLGDIKDWSPDIDKDEDNTPGGNGTEV